MVWVTLTFLKFTAACLRNQNCPCPFSLKFSVYLDEIQYVATTCWFVEANVVVFVCFFVLFLFCFVLEREGEGGGVFYLHKNSSKGENHTDVTMEYTFNFVLCQDTCGPICFKVGLMVNSTRLYSLIPV